MVIIIYYLIILNAKYNCSNNKLFDNTTLFSNAKAYNS